MHFYHHAIARLAGFLVLANGLSAAGDPLQALRDNLYERGRDTCNDGKWAEALPIHERLTRLDPDYGFGWMGLGWSRQYTGDFANAIPAYRRALELGGMPASRIHRHIAECLTFMGKEKESLDELERAINSGLPQLAQLKGIGAFATLRTNSKYAARYRALVGDIDVTGMTREQGWGADLDFLKREVLRMHYNPLRKMTRAELNHAIDEIKSSVATKSDEQVAVEVMHFMARLGDGHTWARVKDQAFAVERGIPILMNQFEDGLFVTGAEETHGGLVGARVDEIEGKAPREVLAKLDPIISADNAMRLLSQGPWTMRFPGVLNGLGLCRSASELHLRVTDNEGRSREVTLSPSAPIAKPVRMPAKHDQALPIHIKRRKDLYWFERIPDSRVIYFEYNACQEDNNKPLNKFADELFDSVESSDIDTLVIDLRWNGGGNLFVSRPLFSRLLKCRKILKPGHLFVIAGRHTFSAAMVFAAQIERYTPAIFVGEPTGSSPNFVGETNLVTLPYSKMIVSISNLYWQNATAMDHRPWIAPKIRTPMSFAMWKQGRDEAVEAILRYNLARK
jgi:hypothetical protein